MSLRDPNGMERVSRKLRSFYKRVHEPELPDRLRLGLMQERKARSELFRPEGTGVRCISHQHKPGGRRLNDPAHDPQEVTPWTPQR